MREKEIKFIIDGVDAGMEEIRGYCREEMIEDAGWEGRKSDSIARQESLKQKTPRIRNRSTSTFAAIFFQPNILYLHLANLGITTRVNFDKSDMVVMTDFKIFMDNG